MLSMHLVVHRKCLSFSSFLLIALIAGLDFFQVVWSSNETPMQIDMIGPGKNLNCERNNKKTQRWIVMKWFSNLLDGCDFNSLFSIRPFRSVLLFPGMSALMKIIGTF